MIKFGDLVTFDEEYRVDSTNTVNVQNADLDAVIRNMEQRGIESDESFNVKMIHKFKKPKQGVFCGIFETHSKLWYDHCYTEWAGEWYRPEKDGFIKVAEVRCEGIRKTYLVPLDNLKEVER